MYLKLLKYLVDPARIGTGLGTSVLIHDSAPILDIGEIQFESRNSRSGSIPITAEECLTITLMQQGNIR